MEKNIVKEKSFDFALRIIDLSRIIKTRHREYDLTRQMKRSGTAIGALIRESANAESKADFMHKLSVSQKEAGETEYWIDLLYRSGHMTQDEYTLIRSEIGELNKLLIAILKKLKGLPKSNH